MFKSFNYFLISSIAFFAILLFNCNTNKRIIDSDPLPNILLIVADDIGWKDVGYNGNKYYETKNIDALVRSAMVFDNAYAASSFCSPTRASILTGLNPSRIGFTTASGHKKLERTEKDTALFVNPKFSLPKSLTRLPLSYSLLSEVLQENGYSTALFGKWHLGLKPFTAENQGFEYTFPKYSVAAGPLGGYLREGTKLFSDEEFEHEKTVPEMISNRIIKYIGENKNKDAPFFINYSDYSGHSPLSAKVEKIEYFKKKAKIDSTLNPVMAAVIFDMDSCIGNIINYLKAEDLYDNTIIFWLSDNGGVSSVKPKSTYESECYKYAKNKPVTINYPLKGEKATTYEGGLRIPFLVNYPKKIKGNLNHSIISTSDIFPTILELINIESNIKFDGVSFKNILFDNQYEERSFFCHQPVSIINIKYSYFPTTVLREKNWKLIKRYFSGENDINEYELFDLDKDIGETNNVVEINTMIFEKLKTNMEKRILETDSFVPFLLDK